MLDAAGSDSYGEGEGFLEMNPSIKRLLFVVTVPPLLGALLIQLFFMLVEISRHAALRMTFAEQILLYSLLAAYGFVICLLPGFCFWGLMEMVWKYGSDGLRRWIPFHGLGAVLGIACGLTVADLGNVHDFEGQRFLVLGGIGWICGLVTSGLVRLTYPSKACELSA